MLKDVPHVIVEIQVDAMYCDAAHVGHGTDHEVTRGTLALALVPPGDVWDNIDWPPVADSEGAALIRTHVAERMMAAITLLLADWPGADTAMRIEPRS